MKSAEYEKAEAFLDRMQEAMDFNPNAPYNYLSPERPEGSADVLARELGGCLADCRISPDELKRITGSLYGRFAVRYCLKRGWPVPVDNKRFVGQVQVGYEKYASILGRRAESTAL